MQRSGGAVPDGACYIGYKEECRYKYGNFDTQHSRGGWAVYHVPARLIIPSFVEEIHIPASVASISDKAFDLIPQNVRMFVEKDNPFYEVRDNKIVDKKRQSSLHDKKVARLLPPKKKTFRNSIDISFNLW